MDVFQMSFSASVLIMTVVIIRALYLHKLPKKAFIVLWGIVVFRLLVPLSIPSRFSIYTGVNMLKSLFANKTTISSPSEIYGIPNMWDMPSTTVPIGTAVSVSISPIEVVWLIGMCLCIMFFIVAYIKCHREFKMSLPIENNFLTRWLQEHPLL